ncbi:MAG: DUF805 domain-containing protein [Flavobacteriales bacterium]|nr:DUF805 domain-containing protein [Flavobacteriales bacterium]
MTLAQSVSSCFNNYATFKGRASRSEFWYFYLFTIIVSFVLSFINSFGVGYGSETIATIGAGLYGIFALAVLLPSLAVTVRRLHDVNRSGWWLLIYLTIIGIFVILYWLCKAGDNNENNYGPPQIN